MRRGRRASVKPRAAFCESLVRLSSGDSSSPTPMACIFSSERHASVQMAAQRFLELLKNQKTGVASSAAASRQAC